MNLSPAPSNNGVWWSNVCWSQVVFCLILAILVSTWDEMLTHVQQEEMIVHVSVLPHPTRAKKYIQRNIHHHLGFLQGDLRLSPESHLPKQFTNLLIDLRREQFSSGSP